MLSAKSPGETVVVTFDFSALSTTAINPTVTASVDSGLPDLNPAAMLSGTPQVVGAKVLQLVTLGQAGTSYEFSCAITAADGVSRYVLSDVLPVLSP